MEITTQELEQKIQNGEKVIVEMWAPWCGPCRMLKPVFERVAQNNSTDVQMYTLNIDENRDTAVKYGVRSIPTIKVFDGGEVKETRVGVIAEQGIKELVTNLLIN
jgi:thioredoxin 1